MKLICILYNKIMKKFDLISMFCVIGDILIIITSFLITLSLQMNINMTNFITDAELQICLNTYTFLNLLLFYLNNLYTPNYYRKLIDKLSKATIVHTTSYIFSTFILYVIKINIFYSYYIIILYIMSLSLILFRIYFMRCLSGNYYQKDKNLKHVIVIGGGNLAQEYIESIENNKEYRVKINGIISNNKVNSKHKYLGTYEEISSILDSLNIEEIIVALEVHEYNYMPSIIEMCEKNGIKISIIPTYNKYIPAKPNIEIIGKVKLFNLRDIPLDDLGKSFVKRFVDIVLGMIALIVFSPIMLIVALGIKLTMPGPILFTQERLGKNKTKFKMYKFRSMKVNNDSDTAWSTSTDTRRTTFGKFIRKFSIDELPQLFNVIKGDMSLIGPRPEIPHYTVKFKEEVPLYMIRNQVKPGMTGWAQVHGLRGDTSIEKRVKYDIYYIENWSLGLDIKIIIMTILGGFINAEKL